MQCIPPNIPGIVRSPALGDSIQVANRCFSYFTLHDSERFVEMQKMLLFENRDLPEHELTPVYELKKK